MKIIHLKSLPLPVLVVELPEKSHGLKLTESGNITFFIYDEMKGSFPVVQKLPKMNLQFLGKLSDLTEQQFEGLVRKVNLFGSDHYVGYDHCGYRQSARESFISAIEAEGYVMQGDMKTPVGGMVLHEGKTIKEWTSKVIDLSRCYVFVGKEEV